MRRVRFRSGAGCAQTRKQSTTLAESIWEASKPFLKQPIIQVLEVNSIGFKRTEAAAGPFAILDTTLLTGLNVRMHCVIKKAQQLLQQKGQGRPSLLN